MIIDGNIIKPSGDLWLSNGETASQYVILGVNDNPSNWREITAEEAEAILNPPEPDIVTPFEIAEALENIL